MRLAVRSAKADHRKVNALHDCRPGRRFSLSRQTSGQGIVNVFREMSELSPTRNGCTSRWYSDWTWWRNRFPSANPLRAALFVMAQIEETIFSEGVFRRERGVLRRPRERGTAGRASNRSDPLGPAMRAISDQSVEVSISDPEVLTWVIGTGQAPGVHPLGGSSPAFHLAPGVRLPQEQVSQLGSRGHREGNQAGCGA
ncbi:MAG TPA: hypothetical protein VF026_20525 [Ktedonobacteraceae bacterium]